MRLESDQFLSVTVYVMGNGIFFDGLPIATRGAESYVRSWNIFLVYCNIHNVHYQY